MISEKEPRGPVLGIIIIIILLVVGGIYVFLNQPTGPTEEDTVGAGIELGPESTSTDLSLVEAELNATNLNSLDAELKDINAELDVNSQ